MKKNLLDRFIDMLGIPQNSEECRWTKSQAYQKRLGWVKSFWIFGGLIMLAVAQPAFILVGSFFLTFMSFAFLEK
ncbi:MAG: hypothetical protein V7785_04430 [Bermanella sp.]